VTRLLTQRISTPNMEVICFSETSVYIWTTRCHIQEDSNIHIYRFENLRSFICVAASSPVLQTNWSYFSSETFRRPCILGIVGYMGRKFLLLVHVVTFPLWAWSPSLQRFGSKKRKVIYLEMKKNKFHSEIMQFYALHASLFTFYNSRILFKTSAECSF
jgi:hypothetical protein